MLKNQAPIEQKKHRKPAQTPPSGAVAHHARFTPNGRGK